MQRVEINCTTGEQSIIDLTPEEIAALPPIEVPDPKVAILAEIESLERTQLLPRITREFMLLQFATVAQAQGVDPMSNIAYAKLKAFDDQITALRNQL
jgi:hypothetical protein